MAASFPAPALTTLHQPLPSVSVKAPKITILPCSLQCFERGLVSCKWIALRRAAAMPSESDDLIPSMSITSSPGSLPCHTFTLPSSPHLLSSQQLAVQPP